MDIQMTVLPKVDTQFGKFNLGYIPRIPNSAAQAAIAKAVAAQRAVLPNPAAQPAAAPALVPSAPGAILPTQSPAYLFPVNTAAPDEAEKGPDNLGLVLGILGVIAVLGIVVALSD